MIRNRSMPASTVIPELAYPDLQKAINWLSDVFGFEPRLRIADHRAQMRIGEGDVILTALRAQDVSPAKCAHRMHAVMVRIEDVDRHYHRALSRGAEILHAPETYPFGERQYSCRDFGGHVWTFSQSIDDVAPESWGAVTT